MIRSSVSLIIFCCLSISAIGQYTFDSSNRVFMVNRYNAIGGTPYLLEGWSKAILHPLKGNSIEHDRVNFNGDSGKFEVVQNEVEIELNSTFFNKIELFRGDVRYLFINRLPENDLTYYRVLHEGNGYLFLEKFDVKLQITGSNYAVSSEREKFVPRTSNYIWKDNQLFPVNSNTNKILDFFDSPALNKEVKNKKLNLKNEADLVIALTYYDEQIAPK